MTPAQTAPTLLVSCVRCERLHAPAQAEPAYPVCPGCRGGHVRAPLSPR